MQKKITNKALADFFDFSLRTIQYYKRAEQETGKKHLYNAMRMYYIFLKNDEDILNILRKEDININNIQTIINSLKNAVNN
ncbi:MAG: hypothetical protein LBS26_02375 [Campylobacteraceae bacterium]|jgi:hypothetical protein|nr:hypothetical protein [Campylobacteraceae bacterium]